MNRRSKAEGGGTKSKVFRAEQVTSLPLLGQLARWLARRYREGSVTRIRTGVGKGLLWKRSHRYQSGFYLGTYEPIVQDFLAQHLEEGSVFWDVGANAGFFSLIGSRLVGSTGEVIAFEPFPQNADLIREQIGLNGLDGVCEIQEVAVTSTVGQVKLLVTNHNATHRLDAEGNLDVTAISLDSKLASAENPRLPDLVKVDVEGAELEVLAGAKRLLDAGTTWIIEAHDRDIELMLRDRLEQNGYTIAELGEGDPEEKVLLLAQID